MKTSLSEKLATLPALSRGRLDAGVVSAKKASDEDAAQMGSKQVETTEKAGGAHGAICDKHGNELHAAGAKEVARAPQLGATGCNLLSLMK